MKPRLAYAAVFIRISNGLFNPLTTTTPYMSDLGRMLSVGAIRFEDRFCASKKGGIGGRTVCPGCRAHGRCL